MDESTPPSYKELRSRSLRACERALDVSLAADGDDVDKLRLGIEAAQLLMMMPEWHPAPPFPPPPPHSHGQIGTQMAFVSEHVTHTGMSDWLMTSDGRRVGEEMIDKAADTPETP